MTMLWKDGKLTQIEATTDATTYQVGGPVGGFTVSSYDFPGDIRETPLSSNPKQAYGDAKVKLQLVPPAAMIAIANGLAEGAKKYGEWNWRDQPVELMTYYGAILRHLVAWLEGEDADQDSLEGKSHLEGAIASLAILIDATAGGDAIDNRPAYSCEGVLTGLRKGSRRELDNG